MRGSPFASLVANTVCSFEAGAPQDQSILISGESGSGKVRRREERSKSTG